MKRTRICIKCKRKLKLSIKNFKFRNDKKVYRTVCRKCTNIIEKCRPSNKLRWREKVEQEKESRKNKKDRVKWILRDSKHGDKKHNFSNNLDEKFVEELIKKGCFYCGETEIQIGLDRIENCKGHTKDNVVAACIRCNIVRRNMPFNAWLIVAKGMRKAREKGLFKNWHIKIGRKNFSE